MLEQALLKRDYSNSPGTRRGPDIIIQQGNVIENHNVVSAHAHQNVNSFKRTVHSIHWRGSGITKLSKNFDGVVNWFENLLLSSEVNICLPNNPKITFLFPKDISVYDMYKNACRRIIYNPRLKTI